MLDLHDATIKDRRCKPIKYSNDTGFPSLVLRNQIFEEAARRWLHVIMLSAVSYFALKYFSDDAYKFKNFVYELDVRLEFGQCAV